MCAAAQPENSANPQPGTTALRSARFPACGFWRARSKVVVGHFADRGSGTRSAFFKTSLPAECSKMNRSLFVTIVTRKCRRNSMQPLG